MDKDIKATPTAHNRTVCATVPKIGWKIMGKEHIDKSLHLMNNDIDFLEEIMEKINNFINWAKNNRWSVIIENNSIKNLSGNILARYNIPDEYKTFLENIKTCTNSEENIWFLCIDDYLEKSEGAFRWNEFEIISLEAANDDAELINEIKNYWNKHLPIIFNVKGEYEYYAINVENKKIVYGYEPEFEESEIVANNFGELLDKIINNEIKL
jgi:hypothetical protein